MLNRALGGLIIASAFLFALGFAAQPPKSLFWSIWLGAIIVLWLAFGVRLFIASRVQLRERDRTLVMHSFLRTKRVAVALLERCEARTDQRGGLVDVRTHPTFVLTDSAEIPFSYIQWGTSESARAHATEACDRMTWAIRNLKNGG